MTAKCDLIEKLIKNKYNTKQFIDIFRKINQPSNYVNISIALMILVNKKSFNIQRGHKMWFCMSFVSIASTINVGAVGNRISMYVDHLQQLLSCVNVMKMISKHDLSHSSFDAKGIDTRLLRLLPSSSFQSGKLFELNFIIFYCQEYSIVSTTYR